MKQPAVMLTKLALRHIDYAAGFLHDAIEYDDSSLGINVARFNTISSLATAAALLEATLNEGCFIHTKPGSKPTPAQEVSTT